ESRMFDQLARYTDGRTEWLQQVLPALLAAAVAIAVAILAHRILFGMLRRFARASDSLSDNILVNRLRRPSRWAMIALALVLVAREVPALKEMWEKIAGFVMPALLGWMALTILRALLDTMALKADISVENNLLARQQRTRLAIINRIGSF